MDIGKEVAVFAMECVKFEFTLCSTTYSLLEDTQLPNEDSNASKDGCED